MIFYTLFVGRVRFETYDEMVGYRQIARLIKEGAEAVYVSFLMVGPQFTFYVYTICRTGALHIYLKE